jgi:hypothetical protein
MNATNDRQPPRRWTTKKIEIALQLRGKLIKLYQEHPPDELLSTAARTRAKKKWRRLFRLLRMLEARALEAKPGQRME